MSPREILETLWLVRVPALSLAIMASFGFAAAGKSRSMLGALFDMDSDPFGLLVVAITAFLLASTCLTAINMVLHLGTARFNIPALQNPGQGLQLTLFCLTLLFPAVFLFNVYRLTPALSGPLQLAIDLVAFVIASGLVLLAKITQMYLTDHSVTVPPPPHLVFPTPCVPPLNRYLVSLYTKPPGAPSRAIKDFLNGRAQWFFSILAVTGDGYFIPNAPGLVLESAQVFTTALTAFCFAAYLFLGTFGHGLGVPGPALAYVLLAQMVFTWILAGLCFLFDRFRFPVLVPLAIFVIVSGRAPESDHFFRAQTLSPQATLSTPAQVLSRYEQAPVLVASAGGGIQSAAWTTSVIYHLSTLYPDGSFATRLALFSGVSGGSVGAMNIGSVWPRLDLARELSRRPALDAIAWAWVNPDVWKIITPLFHSYLVDRGQALEQSWETQQVEGHPIALRNASLASWGSPSTSKPPLPAFLFNSTTVESGAPTVFATTAFPQSESKLVDATRKARSFRELYPDFGLTQPLDLPISTAVRLSASFPYVSPAARPYFDTMRRKSFHFVDGGYYDNYGVYTLLAWLEAALHTQPAPIKSVAIIRLLGFPPDPAALGSAQGWGFQTTAPFDAFLHTRETAQFVESDTVLTRFIEHWSSLHVDVRQFVFRYPAMADPNCREPALSWKLTAAQCTCLDTAWNDREIQKQAAALKVFLDTH